MFRLLIQMCVLPTRYLDKLLLAYVLSMSKTGSSYFFSFLNLKNSLYSSYSKRANSLKILHEIILSNFAQCNNNSKS